MSARQTKSVPIENEEPDQFPQQEQPERQLGDKKYKHWEQYEIPAGRLYCKLEAIDARSDYRENMQCARLFGISAQEFERSLNPNLSNESFDVFLLDIEWTLWEQLLAKALQYGKERFADNTPEWFEVSYRTNRAIDSGEAYAYPLFLASAPTFMDVFRITPVVGRPVPPLQTAKGGIPMPLVRVNRMFSKASTLGKECALFSTTDNQGSS